MSDIGQGHDEGALLAVAAPAQEEVPAPGRARSTSQLPLERLRGFHPGWFGAVMGTAIVGVAASMNPGGAASLASSARTFSQTMVVIAVVLAVVLVVGYLGRFVLHTDAALADLRDPVAGALYGTLPGGILVLAVAAGAIGPTWFSAPTVRDLVAGLAWVGVPLAFVLSVVLAYLLFVRSELVPETVNGGWFIPPVVNIVVPLVLVSLVPESSPATARALLLASYGFFGMGFVLYLLIVTMLHHRLVLHPLPHAGLAPSLWIGLGPIGVGALALVKMAAAGTAVFGPAAPAIAVGIEACSDGAMGLRRVVARRRRALARALPSIGPAALWRRLVGFHLPPRRLHRRHARPGKGVGPELARLGRRRAVRAPRPVLARGRGPHGLGASRRRGLAASTFLVNGRHHLCGPVRSKKERVPCLGKHRALSRSWTRCALRWERCQRPSRRPRVRTRAWSPNRRARAPSPCPPRTAFSMSRPAPSSTSPSPSPPRTGRAPWRW